MPNNFGKRGRGEASQHPNKTTRENRSDKTLSEMRQHLEPARRSSSTFTYMLGGAILAGLTGLIASAGLIVASKSPDLPVEVADSGPALAAVAGDASVEDENLEELLRQQRAERERMDREEAEREQQRQEEDERWQRAQDERVRRDAEAARHAQQMELERKKQAKLEQQHQELLEQNAKIERQRARAEQQRRKADERRHQEQLAEEKRSQKAIRDTNRPRGVVGGIIRSEPTKRMLGDGPGLFERD